MQIKQLHVLLNTSIKSEKFKSLEEMKQHMTKEAAIDKKKNGRVSSEEEEEEKEEEGEEEEEEEER